MIKLINDENEIHVPSLKGNDIVNQIKEISNDIDDIYRGDKRHSANVGDIKAKTKLLKKK